MSACSPMCSATCASPPFISDAIDNDLATWNRYANRYWPAMYLIDKCGGVRYRRIGEGDMNKLNGKSKACSRRFPVRRYIT
jgi:hypothetical protein